MQIRKREGNQCSDGDERKADKLTLRILTMIIQFALCHGLLLIMIMMVSLPPLRPVS